MTENPNQIQACNQRWASIKSEAFKLYIQRDMQLEETMAAIKESHGFNASPRMWKVKLKEWGYKKYISTRDMSWIVSKGEARKLEDKETNFFLNGTQIRKERIENFKRRGPGEGSLSIATPPEITYNTPLLDSSEEGEEPHQESPHPVSVSILSSDIAHDGSQGPSGLDMQEKFTLEYPGDGVLVFSMLDRYLEEEQQPWSPYNLLCSTRKHDQPDGSYEVPAFELDAVALDEPERLLTQYQIKYGEFAIVTLEQEFKLARVAEMIGNHEGAIYHCHRILGQGDPQVVVQTFLGMVYFDTSRPKDATSFLFLALTDFILDFDFRTSESNLLRLQSIEILFSRLASHNGQEWIALSACMRRLKETILEAVRGGITTEIFPKLLLLGISFARELCILEDTSVKSNAEEMYESLLGHSWSSCGTIVLVHRIEFTTAYQEYGLLLRKRGNWIDCAEQLLQACELALYSGLHDGQLIASLKCNCFDVLMYLSSESSESDVPERINKSLAELRRNYNYILMKNNSEDRQLSRVEEYLLSDLPVVLSEDHEPVSLTTYSPTQEVASGTVQASTASKSTGSSYKYGLTYTESEITGISNSIFYVG